MITRLPPPFSQAVIAVLVCGLATAALADVSTEEKKPGFFKKLFGGGKEEAPATPPAKAPATAPSTGKPPRVVITTTKPGGSTKKVELNKPKSAPAKTTAKAATPKPQPAPAKDVTSTAKRGEGEFKGEPIPSIQTNSNVAATKFHQDGWDVVKINGRDYVTVESIRDFYNPFFGFNNIKKSGGNVSLESRLLVLRVTVGSNVILLNSMKFILSYTALEDSGRVLISRLDLVKLIDPIFRPNHIQGAELFNTVVIDAGHGGHDSGARGVYGYEKEFTLKLALNLRAELIKLGFKVVMTRTADVFISLSGRVAIANQIPNSLFISLHFNSSQNQASGVETWALTPKDASATITRGGGYNFNGVMGNRQDSANIALASAVHAMITRTVSSIDRGIMRAQWSVLTGIQQPGILVEGGFVTNPREGLLIANDNYQKVLAIAIATGVINFRKAIAPPLSNK